MREPSEDHSSLFSGAFFLVPLPLEGILFEEEAEDSDDDDDDDDDDDKESSDDTASETTLQDPLGSEVDRERSYTDNVPLDEASANTQG